jgi:hypothetical protein
VTAPAFEIDLRQRLLTLHAGSGTPTILPFPPGMFDVKTSVERISLSAGLDQLLIGLPNDEEAIVELAGTGQAVEDLRADRPVVYLDQNHWSSFAAARFGHKSVSRAEAEAAGCLIALAEAKEILLPHSAGHLVETVPLYGVPRVALATTILQTSRGWQMRSPIHVRTEEILRHIQGHEPIAGEVFAPQTDGLFATHSFSLATETTRDFPIAEMLKAVPAVLGLYEALVDDEAIPDVNGGGAKAAAWAKNFAEIAQRLHAASEPPEMIRRVANGNVIYDLRGEIDVVAREAHLPPERVIERLMEPDDPISRMPTVAQMRQILFARLSNKTQKWESNDLIDINYLTCAAGYADVVVGERRTIGYLRQARRPRPGARLATNLTEAVALLGYPKSRSS